MSCLMLRGIVQIGCHATFADLSRQFCKYGSKGNFHHHKYGKFGSILFVSVYERRKDSGLKQNPAYVPEVVVVILRYTVTPLGR